MTSESQDTAEMEALWALLGDTLQQSQSEEAKKVLDRIDTLAEKMIADGEIEGEFHKSEMLFNKGNIAAVEGRQEDAFNAFKAALPHVTRHMAQHPTVKARELLGCLHYNIGTFYCNTNRLNDAEAALTAAATHQEANVSETPNDQKFVNQLAQTRFNLGNLFLSTQRHQEAAMCFFAARNLWLELLIANPDDHRHAHNLARSYFNFCFVAGPTLEAHDAFEQAQAVWEKLLGALTDAVEPRCDIARCYFNHSSLLVQAGRHEDALGKIERALFHIDRLVELSPDEPSFIEFRTQAIEDAEQLRQFQPTKVVAENLAGLDQLARAAREAKDWQKLKEVGLGHVELARNLGQANRPVEMEQVTRAGTKLLAELASHDPRNLENAQLEPAILYDLHADLKSMGRFDAAEEALREALHHWRQLNELHKDNVLFQHWLAEVHNNIGIICMTTGRSRAAISAYQTAMSMREKMSKSSGLFKIQEKNPENKLSLGGIQCNLGSIFLSIGDIAKAREHYNQAIKTIESVRKLEIRSEILEQFLANARSGLAQCSTKKTIDRDRFSTSTVSLSQPGPPTFGFEVSDADLAVELNNVDRLRVDADDTIGDAQSKTVQSSKVDEATEKLVKTAPDCAEAWLLRGLVLGYFLSEEGGAQMTWSTDRHEEATTAFYEALVLRPDYYEARLYKGMALCQAAHAARASLNAIDSFIPTLPEEDREGFADPFLRRFTGDISRATESLEAAARLRPEDGRPLFELAALYDGLGMIQQAQPYLNKLKTLDSSLFEKFQQRLETAT